MSASHDVDSQRWGSQANHWTTQATAQATTQRIEVNCLPKIRTVVPWLRKAPSNLCSFCTSGLMTPNQSSLHQVTDGFGGIEFRSRINRACQIRLSQESSHTCKHRFWVRPECWSGNSELARPVTCRQGQPKCECTEFGLSGIWMSHAIPSRQSVGGVLKVEHPIGRRLQQGVPNAFWARDENIRLPVLSPPQAYLTRPNALSHLWISSSNKSWDWIKWIFQLVYEKITKIREVWKGGS